ncbi:MAG: hypothetical protein H6704_14320 [Myxococcales bacterium]|nr:hypothetical protein [Myxococcales bacterium]
MRSTLTAALLLGLTGCLPTGSNDFAADAAPACTPGRVEACTCADQRGQRTCDGDGVFGACVCAGGDAAPPDDDGGPPLDDGGPPGDATPPPPADGGPPPACEAGEEESRDCEGGIERRACAGGAWSAWSPCAPVAACEDGQTEQQTCGVEDNGTRTRTCVGGAWSGFGPCDDPDRPCDDGAIEDVPCGLNGRGRQSHTCEGERFGPFSPCEDPDACVDGAAMAEACGVNGRGLQRRACEAGAWTELSACEDPDACADDATQQRPCGLNDRGQQRRTCAAGQWTEWAACQDPDVCEDGVTEQDPQPCGVEGNGTRRRACAAGQWGAWGACDDPDRRCDEGVTETLPCGLNGRGELERVCQDGRLMDDGGCVDPDVCVDGGAQDEPCGRNQAGSRRRLCVNGNWGAWSACDDPDACTNGDVDTRACGLNDRGAQRRTCRQGQWGGWVACDDPDVCRDGDVATAACGEDGERSRRCVAGAWGAWGACEQDGQRCDPAADAHCRQCTDALEPNDRSADGTVVGAGEIDDLSICDDVDPSDFFAFETTGPTYMHVNVTVPRGDDFAPLTLHFTQPGGSLGLGGGSSHGGDSASVTRSGLLERVGRHTIEVRADDGAGHVPYAFDLTLEPLPLCDLEVPPDDCIDCDDAFGNNHRLAAAAVVGAGAFEDLSVCAREKDYYRVDLESAAEVTMRVTPSLKVGYMFTDFLDADGERLPFSNGTEVDGVIMRRAERLRPGPMYVTVDTPYGAARYDLEIIIEPIDLPDCNDGADNDGDGAIDAADTGCRSLVDTTEGDPPAGAPPVCANGEDDDEDGQIDYPDDLQCAAAGAGAETLTCAALVPVIAIDEPGRYATNTGGRTNHLEATCGGGARAGEVVFAIEVDEPTTVLAEVVEGEYDTVLFARASCDDPASELACDDDGGPERLSSLEVELPAGGGFIVLDGYNAATGAATVEFSW